MYRLAPYKIIPYSEGMKQDKFRQKTIQPATMRLWPDAGMLIGIGKAATYDAAHRNQIPVIRIGRRLLVSRAALDRMLEGRPA